MCRFCNVWVCVCMGSLMCGCVFVYVCVYMSFKYVGVCTCIYG